MQAGGRIAEWAAGVYAGAPALAADPPCAGTGQGAHIDVSQLEAMLIATNLFGDLNQSLNGRPPLAGPARWIELPSIEPTSDGWVGFNTNAMQMFHDFLVLIERPDWLEDSEMLTFPGRMKRLAGVERGGACVHHQAHDRRGRRARLADAHPGRAGEQWPNSPRTRAVRRARRVRRRSRRRLPSTTAAVPDRGRVAATPPRPAPKLGEHSGRIEARRTGTTAPSPAATAPAPQPVLPFKGLKVLDVTCWWAGPAVTQLFAMLGAEVLHVEAIQRPDGMRLAAAGTFLDRDRWWEYSFFFLSINENKRDLTLDLNRPEGIALLEQPDRGVRHRRRELHAARRRELRPRVGASARAQPAGDHAAHAGVRAHRAVA